MACVLSVWDCTTHNRCGSKRKQTYHHPYEGGMMPVQWLVLVAVRLVGTARLAHSIVRSLSAAQQLSSVIDPLMIRNLYMRSYVPELVIRRSRGCPLEVRVRYSVCTTRIRGGMKCHCQVQGHGQSGLWHRRKSSASTAAAGVVREQHII